MIFIHFPGNLIQMFFFFFSEIPLIMIMNSENEMQVW